MAKRKISKLQASRIKEMQQKRISDHHEKGVIIAHYYNYVDLESQEGDLIQCQLRQHLGAVVPGDRVIWERISPGNGVVTGILPRTSLLVRSDRHGNVKPIAANIDQILIVIAIKPLPSPLLLDSYLVAAENLKMKPLLVINKVDLMTKKNNESITEIMKLYKSLGYTIIQSSTRSAHGLEPLKNFLKDKTSIFVGQSGVGKSSLVSLLLPDQNIVIKELAGIHEFGAHTTTTARLYHLSGGGEIIDSPGVRDFYAQELSRDQITAGFIEFKPYLGQCEFRNCRHENERGCAIIDAVNEGKINQSRVKSYHYLLSKMRSE